MRHIFIINNSTGKQNASIIVRKELKRLEVIESFNYLVFDTNGPKDEIRLTKLMCDIFSDEKIRFYICGGSGTVANVISSITDLNNTEIAFYPNGSSCDILKCFNCTTESFNNIESLVNGHVLHLDYIKSNKHVSGINTFSTGVDVDVSKIFRRLHVLTFISGRLTYMLATVMAVLRLKSKKIRITADNNQIYEGNYMWIIAANGRYAGASFYLSDKNNVEDGYMDVIIVSKLRRLKILKSIGYVASGNIDKLGNKVVKFRSSVLKIECLSGNCDFNYDGEILEGKDIDLTCIHHGINFVVPEDVTLKE